MSPVFIAILFAIGIALILIELVTPGIMIGLIGLGCLCSAVYFTWQVYGAVLGLATSAAALGFVGVVVVVTVRRLTLTDTLDPERGYVSFDPRLRELLGVEGPVVTALRPSGFCRLNGRRVTVVTRGEMLDAETMVRVIEVEGARVVVKAV